MLVHVLTWIVFAAVRTAWRRHRRWEPAASASASPLSSPYCADVTATALKYIARSSFVWMFCTNPHCSPLCGVTTVCFLSGHCQSCDCWRYVRSVNCRSDDTFLSACACLRKRTCREHPVTSSLTRREAPSAEAEMSLVGKSASRVRLAVEHESHVGSFFLRLGVIGETLSFLPVQCL